MSAPTNRQERRKARTRAAILSAAEGLFGIRGVEGVSVDDITTAADVAKGTFYNHFPDKEALALEVSRLIRLEVSEQVEHLNAAVGDPAERVARAICVFLRFACLEPDRARAMTRLYRGAADPDNPVNRRVSHDVGEGLSSGRFRAPAPLSGIIFVMGGVYASLAYVIEAPDCAATKRLAGEIASLVLTGLGLASAEAASIAQGATGAVFADDEGS